MKFLKDNVFLCFVRSRRLFVCQSLHKLKTTDLYGCWVSFQFWFGVGGTWIGVWIFVIRYLGGGGGGVDFCFIIFGGLGWLVLEFLGNKFCIFFFYFLPKYFLTFFQFFFYFLLFFFVLWWNFINICSTFTHSFTQFFVYWGEV